LNASQAIDCVRDLHEYVMAVPEAFAPTGVKALDDTLHKMMHLSIKEAANVVARTVENVMRNGNIIFGGHCRDTSRLKPSSAVPEQSGPQPLLTG
jgi:hypothetical protein